MARTQVRLDQITGSFGNFEGGIVDNRATAASLAAIPEVSGSLVDVLSHMASAIKRIHGGSAFTSQNAGVFGTVNVSGGTLTLADDQISGDKVEGGTINATTINTLTSTNLQVTNLKANDGTSAGSIADSTGIVTLSSAVLTTADINGGTVDAADITVGAGKTLDVSGGTLTLADNQISGDKVEGGTIAAITITSLSGQDATFTGNLTVQGTTTTVDSTNLQVEDPIILMGSGSSGEGAAGDRGLIMAIASETNPAMFWDESADQFAFVRTNASATDTVITPDAYADLRVLDLTANDLSVAGITASDLTDNRVVIAGTSGLLEDDANFTFNGTQLTVGSSFNVQQSSGVTRLGAAEIGSASDRIDLSGVSGADLRIAAAADLKLEAAGGQVYVTGSLLKANGAHTLGTSTTLWDEAHVIVLSASDGTAIVFPAASNQARKKINTGNIGLINAVATVDDNPANGLIGFADGFFTGSTYTNASSGGQIPLALSRVEYDDFVSNFGSVSIIKAINAARTGTPGAGKATAVRSGGTLSAGSIFTLSGFSHQDVTDASRTAQVDVFVNGQLLLSGALSANDYTLDGLSNNQIKFSFDLENDDVVTGIIR